MKRTPPPLRRRCCQCQIKTKLARFMFAASNVEGGDGHRPPTTTTRDTYPTATSIIPALLSIGRLLTSALPWRGKYRSAEERGSGNGRLGQKHFTYEPSADVGHGVILMRSIILLAFTPTWTMREVSPYSECERPIGRGRHSLWYSDT